MLPIHLTTFIFLQVLIEWYLWWRPPASGPAASALPTVQWHWDSHRWETWCRSRSSTASPERRKRQPWSLWCIWHKWHDQAEDDHDPQQQGLRWDGPAGTRDRQKAASGPETKHRKPGAPISSADLLAAPRGPAEPTSRLHSRPCSTFQMGKEGGEAYSVHLWWRGVDVEQKTREERRKLCLPECCRWTWLSW